MTLVLLASRNAVRQGRRSLLLGGAAALGVLVMSLAGAIVSGFSAAALDNLSLGLGGHVKISGFTASTSGRWQNRMPRPSETRQKALTDGMEGVISVSAQASAVGILVFGTKEARVPLLGIEDRGSDLFRRGLTLKAGSWEAWAMSRRLILDSATVDRLGVGLGDEVLVRMVTASGQQNLVEYQLAAVFDTLDAGGRSGGLVALGDLAADLNLDDEEVTSLIFTLEDAGQAPAVARSLADRISDLADRTEVVTVQDAMGQLATILSTLRWLSATVFLVMLALVAGGVANTFRMVLLERVREIGTLRCLGLQRSGVLGLFLMESALVTAVGGMAGAFASLTVGELLRWIPPGWVASAGLVLRKGHLPVSPDWLVWWTSWTAVTAVGAFASWGPARRAASLRPAEALATQ